MKLTNADGTVTDIDMPETSNVLQWFAADGTKVSVRPSGTEPKIKFYLEIKGKMECQACFLSQEKAAEGKIEQIKKTLGI